MLQKVQDIFNFFFDLIQSAEDMRVILLKASNSCEPSERATCFISMQNAEVCHSDGKVAVGFLESSKHHAMPRAVHRLQSKLLFFDIEEEHIVPVLGGVPGNLPKLH